MTRRCRESATAHPDRRRRLARRQSLGHRLRGFELVDIGHRQVLELGLNVVSLGNDRVLMPAGNQELAAACRAHGLEVIAPDMSMITPAGGGVHCICQPLRRDSA